MSAASLRLALFQYAAREGEDAAARLERLDAAAADAATRGARLLVTPEMFASGYMVAPERIRAAAEGADGPFARGVAAVARRHGLAIAYGGPEAAAGGAVANTVRCIDADGAVLAEHRKIRLAGPGERAVYVPGSAGPGTVFELGGLRMALLICYDVEFPELVRARALAGAEVLLVPTALVREHPFVARHMVPTRAFENGVFVAYCNYAGREGSAAYLGESVVAGPEGTVAAIAGDTETLLIADVDRAAIERARSILPYLDDARGLVPAP